MVLFSYDEVQATLISIEQMLQWKQWLARESEEADRTAKLGAVLDGWSKTMSVRRWIMHVFPQ